MSPAIGKLWVVVATFTMVLLTTARANLMQLFFNDRRVWFNFYITQRCYTISHCFKYQSVNAEWKGLPDSSEMVWFSDDDCQEVSIHDALTAGTINFKGGVLDNRVSSFMVRQYSMYPINGIVDYCHEYALLNSTNSSTASSTFSFDDAGFATNSSLTA
ncbi:hypothetical protein PRNP1_010037 [Phytophthora ramorum]